MDTENNLEIKEMLPESILEGLSELHQSNLQEKINQIVESRVNEQLQAAIKSAEVSYDAMMNERLEKVINAMEESFKRDIKETYNHLRARERKHLKEQHDKFSKILESTNAKHEAKYKNLKENTLANVKKNSENFREKLTNVVLEFVENEIEKRIPVETLKENVRHRAAYKLVESLKQMLNVDEASSRKMIKEPLREAVSLLKESNSKEATLIKENTELKEKLDESNAQIEQIKRDSYLNERLATIPNVSQRNYLRRVCEGASKEWIEKNFDLSCKFFRESVSVDNETLAKQTIASKKPLQRTKAPLGVKKLAQSLNEHAIRTGKKPVAKSETAAPVSSKTAKIKSILSDIERDEMSEF